MADQATSIKLYPIQVCSEAPEIKDMDLAVEQAIDHILKSPRSLQLKAGAKIAVTAGSRGISNYVEILSAVIRVLKVKGFDPFLFSAMGSHGRGEAEGQKEVLDSMGITEEAIGCPVSCSSEVDLIDEFQEQGRSISVYCAKEALQADGVIVLNRIKPHTSFSGNYESGLLKMMTVGMGRAKGADMFHSLGANHLARMIPLISSRVLERAPVLGGIGILENAKEHTAVMEGIPHDRMFEREKILLEQAKRLMPRLPADHADLLIVGEMGKNFSGTGMDTNIIGRVRIQGLEEPKKPYFQYIGVLRLSEPSHGNATGIGLADFTTEKLVKEIDKTATYLNCATSGFVVRAAIPMTFDNDRALINGAIKMLRADEGLRMMVIRNTLHIEHLWVSEAIYDEIKDQPQIKLMHEPFFMPFDEDGNVVWQEG